MCCISCANLRQQHSAVRGHAQSPNSYCPTSFCCPPCSVSLCSFLRRQKQICSSRLLQVCHRLCHLAMGGHSQRKQLLCEPHQHQDSSAGSATAWQGSATSTADSHGWMGWEPLCWPFCLVLLCYPAWQEMPLTFSFPLFPQARSCFGGAMSEM